MTNEQIDKIFNKINNWASEGRFEEIDKFILQSIKDIKVDLMLTILTITSSYKKELKNRKPLYELYEVVVEKHNLDKNLFCRLK